VLGTLRKGSGPADSISGESSSLADLWARALAARGVLLCGASRAGGAWWSRLKITLYWSGVARTRAPRGCFGSKRQKTAMADVQEAGAVTES
jgi:hypothetical protein